ncbi:hypothetical protein BU26DRAFT_557166 [Trematosphaeria pertusa]|uniref:RNase III domain-containing protein n=1 Tax=Trematosphaeria pertusa TaxID=390896 RepID=A0A6A6IYX3_9PLEO|nr:uncharacterized protein BU26DRAFT_557166 [Trematosphaeria pertusa]KAF2255659.1 hypothetical protein BU26DRAFT_557166 [Trematosphaeria pertusa]
MARRHWLVRRFKRFGKHVTAVIYGETSEPGTSSSAFSRCAKAARHEQQPALDYVATQSTACSLNQHTNLPNSKEDMEQISNRAFYPLASRPTAPALGPRSGIPDLFYRRDSIYFHLSTRQLRWQFMPPKFHHDVFDAAKRVNNVEATIGHTFRNKMLCVEALKMSGMHSPLYFDGSIHPVAPNNRLALLGDRVLSLQYVRFEQYTEMDQDTVTRASLAVKGRALGFHEAILQSPGMQSAKANMVAETFEAILGAAYVDSGNQLSAVTRVIKRIGLDEHRLLKVPQSLAQELAQEMGEGRAGADAAADIQPKRGEVDVSAEEPALIRGISSSG